MPDSALEKERLFRLDRNERNFPLPLYRNPTAAPADDDGDVMPEYPTYERLEKQILELTNAMERQRSALDSLMEREEKYRLIAEQSADFIFTMDIDQEKFTYVSPSVERIFGYTPDACLEMEVRDFLTVPCYELQREKMQVALAEGRKEPEVLEVEVVHRDGQVFPVEVHARFLFNAQDDPVELLGVARDISERRQAELERAQLQMQLIQAQKVEAVGRLAGGVAHDFNNMLAVIIGRCEMALEKAACDPTLFSDVESILKAARHSADLTRQLLAFGRKQDVTPRVICLNKVGGDIFGMLQHLVGSDIKVDWRPGRELWPVEINDSQINQILANLCVNSRDAIAGPGRITIRTENVRIARDDRGRHPHIVSGDHVLLTVNDTGCGIDPKIQERIFDPFFTTKALGKGTGLGLSTIYGIVKQHGGHIDVRSKPRKGATFRIYLPRYQETI